jgi:hypothetical protein
MPKITPARVAAVLGAIASLLAGLAPAIANLDLSSTAGVIAAIVAIGGIVVKWLDGQAKHEARNPRSDAPTA